MAAYARKPYPPEFYGALHEWLDLWGHIHGWPKYRTWNRITGLYSAFFYRLSCGPALYFFDTNRYSLWTRIKELQTMNARCYCGICVPWDVPFDRRRLSTDIKEPEVEVAVEAVVEVDDQELHRLADDGGPAQD